MTPEKHKTLLTYAYGVYALSVFMQFQSFTMLAGLVAVLVMTGLLYARRREADHTLHASHYTWLIRTFWIGSGVYVPVASVVFVVAFFFFVDIGVLANRVSSGALASPADMEAFLREEYLSQIGLSSLAAFGPVLAWWLWRCWRGYRLLREDAPVETPQSWL